eukprot:4796763-Pleurochrysis_carterae.AAC.1
MSTPAASAASAALGAADSGGAASHANAEDVDSMTVPQLRASLRALQQDTGGTKAVLKERLRDAHAAGSSTGTKPASAPPSSRASSKRQTASAVIDLEQEDGRDVRQRKADNKPAVAWFWGGDTGWEAYPPAHTVYLEKAFQSGKPTCKMDSARCG